MGKSPSQLVLDLRAYSAGCDEWRVQHPETGAYCIMFARHRNGCLFPEDDCRKWHAEFIGKYPQHPHSNYVIACVRVLDREDRLMQEAASIIEELTKAQELDAAVPRWIPIADAPRDGTEIDLWCKAVDCEFRVTGAAWNKKTGGWEVDGEPLRRAFGNPGIHPTHYRSVPQPPEATP